MNVILISLAIDKFNYTLNYGTRFGGATAIKVDHYKKVNGHSNKFWGWGGEDNDMEVRYDTVYHCLSNSVI